jgi:putative transposase
MLYAGRVVLFHRGDGTAGGNEQPLSDSRHRYRRRGVWQRRFWEHAIRDQRDFNIHCDYLHYNPVKHGYVTRVADWPYSSFHRFVANGTYPSDWAAR